MGMNTDLTRIRDYLTEVENKICIFSHPNPDGDSIGSTIGLYHILIGLGKHVSPVLPGPLPRAYDFLLADIPVGVPPTDVRDCIAVVLDCSSIQRIHQTGQNLNGAVRVINIDHHLNNELFGDFNYVDTSAAAVGQIIYQMFQASASFGKEAAEALFVSLFTDTGRFSYSNTDYRALSTGAELLKLGVKPSIIYNEIFQAKSPGYYHFLAEALACMELHCLNKLAILPLNQDLLTRHSLEDWELEEINDYPRSIKGVQVSAVIREPEANLVKISLRSKGEFSVAELARSLGGGGHINAAGATVQMSISEAKDMLIRSLEQELNK